MDTFALLGSLMGLGLSAGIRLYATVLAVGLGIRLGLLHLNPGLEHLSVLASPYVLIPVAVAFALEFLADKIPWVDSAWDAFHTVIRPVGAALIGAVAIGAVEPKTKVAIMVLCGGVALTSHSAKAGARLLVNHSPEPFSNAGLSFAEDAGVLFLTWLALEHPLAMLALAGAFLALFLWLAPKVYRLVRASVRALAARVNGWNRGASTQPLPYGRGSDRSREREGL